MNHRFTTHLTALTAVALLLFGASQALAGGTASGTDISNSATLDYTVNSIEQDQKSSNTVTFKVDKKVDLTVATTDAALVEVTPGATNQVLTFTVTNTGNDTQDIRLSAIANVDTTADPFGGALTDNFDATVVGVYVESGDSAGYQSGEDTATYIDELAPDASETVYIVRTIPTTQVDEDMAVYALVGEVRAGGAATTEGAALTETAIGDVDDAVVDILFADAAGSDDAANDAKHSARSAFLVVTADMDAAKTQSIGGGYAIPGATVTYSIAVENSGSAAATAVIIIDQIPANTTYTAFTACTGTKAWSINGTDWLAAEPADPTTVTHIRCTIATIAAAGSETVSFQVEID